MEYGMGWGWLGMILFWLVPLFVVIVLAAAIKYLVAAGPAPNQSPRRAGAMRAFELTWRSR